MVDFSVFRNRSFSGAILGSVGMNFSFWPFMIYLPIYFQAGLGYDAVQAGTALLAYTLPTLLAPPLGERLATRFRAGIVIPTGLFAIGAGFLLMHWGSGTADASWLTLLPGCLLAGLGLGVINTPVTNTTTGSVSASRAGMASGIDMSARLITLAVNIALMGFLLLAGIADALRRALPELAVSLPALAERIAAGHLATLHREFPALAALDPSGTIAHAALLRGFGGVMLYGALGVWMLAALSALAFHGGSRRPAVACASRP